EVIQILEKRIDPQGVMEYRIQEHGQKRILIQVPGATKVEIDRLKERITRLGKLEFRLATTDQGLLAAARKGQPVPGYYVHWLKKKRGYRGDLEGESWYLVGNRVEVTGERLRRVFPDAKGLEPVVGFEFDDAGSKTFARITERNIGAPLAIILDDELVSAPVIRERIPGHGIIEGSFTQEQVNDLVATLRAGSLPADLELEMESFVGPSLGKDSIDKGIRAGLVGSALVLIFMAAYYLLSGLLADFAVFLNLGLVLGAMALLKATLTMPGIAGLVLTVGMAVDANVLIFERIREERARGKQLSAAIKAGYERAFLAIFDSNLTTIITAIILYAVGTGPVKGFAVTLSVGLLFNMFTAIFVTRAIFDMLVAKQMIHDLPMMQWVPPTNIPFISMRRTAMACSLAIIVLGTAVFVVRGRENYDIDFTGGNLIQVRLANPTPAEQVRSTMARAGYEKAEVQSIWTPHEAKGEKESREFGIRIKGLTEQKVQEKLTADLKKALNLGGDPSVSFAAPLVCAVEVKSGADEPSVRKALHGVGYTDEDIKTIVTPGARAKRFSIALKEPPDEKGTLELRQTVVAALRTHVAQQKVSLLIKTGKEADRPVEAEDVREGDVEIEADRVVDSAVLEAELGRAGYSGLRVRDRGGVDFGRKFLASGKAESVGALKKNPRTTLTVPVITFTSKGEAVIELKDALDTVSLRDQVLLPGALSGKVARVSMLDVKAQRFDIEFKELTASKTQEKIREDVTAAFAGNLYAESIPATLEVVEAPAPKADEPKPDGKAEGKAPEKKEETAADRLLSLKLGKPLTIQRIRESLASVGYGDLLVGEYDAGKTYSSVQLKAPPGDLDAAKADVQKAFVTPDPIKRVVSIGAVVATEMKNRAILAIALGWVAIIFYVWFRFGELRFGVAGVIALVHDVLIALGAIAVGDMIGNWSPMTSFIFGDVKINMPMIAAILTVIGFSINDTIVIFDRIRENMAGSRKMLTAEVIDLSVNQTLSRTFLTTGTLLMTLLALFFFAGPVVHGFAFALLVGCISGTYSTVFIAAPVLVEWDNIKKGVGWFFWLLALPIRILLWPFTRGTKAPVNKQG
ncbi:MAG: protein translocase subunit SecD, partial [Planctomycetes bacterium]|nr:protein translocase subunit SecD [Planctomycetota bacterium]